MNPAWLVDFDGTVFRDDVGAALVGRFASGRETEALESLERGRNGTLGHRQLAEFECRRIVARDEALEFARGSLLDWCRERRIPARPFPGFAAPSEALAA